MRQFEGLEISAEFIKIGIMEGEIQQAGKEETCVECFVKFGETAQVYNPLGRQQVYRRSH